MDILRQTSCMVVNYIMGNSFASLFNCTTVARSSHKMMASVLDDRRLTMNACGRARCGPVFAFLVFWLQVAI